VIPRLRYTVAEAAEVLGISRSMVENIIRESGLTVHTDTPGGHRYISGLFEERSVVCELPYKANLGVSSPKVWICSSQSDVS
jgi:excisionase family DNA binding protein